MKKNTQKLKTNEAVKAKPALQELQRELALKFASLGVLLNEMYRANSGNKMLGLPDNQPLRGAYERVDVSSTIIGSHLPIYYTYAYDGRILPGHERTVNPFGQNEAELLRDFLELFGKPSGYTEFAEDVVDGGEVERGGLDDMMDRMIARHYLDEEFPLTIQQLALLANLNERTVKNATIPTTGGKNSLPLNDRGEVDHTDAIRWLMARAERGFIPTKRTSFPAPGEESDEQLDGIEIPAFIKQRLIDRFSKNDLDARDVDFAAAPTYNGAFIASPDVLVRAGAIAGLEAREVQQAMQYPLAIPPHQCAGLAKAIGVDPTWFTLQVMRALYPKEMDMVLNPQHYRQTMTVSHDPLAAIEITLTDTMIRHGYIDIPAAAKSMFPADCFGTREKDDTGGVVKIHYGLGQTAETDIRVKSEKTISPRKRFTGWLQTEVSAKAGDRIRIERTAEREYQLRFQPVAAGTVSKED